MIITIHTFKKKFTIQGWFPKGFGQLYKEKVVRKVQREYKKNSKRKYNEKAIRESTERKWLNKW